jgi:2-polyprenyl-3-methyl-5-hydroxy-6-metoxy-1,4-benzoquinol methylase
MTSGPIPDDREAGTLELIDRALASAKEAAHACRSEVAREHFEYALALLRESWIAESGQNARGSEKVMADVKCGLGLIAAVFAKEGGR